MLCHKVISFLVCHFLQVNISMLLRYIIQIIGSLVFMFTLSPKLTGVLISVVPVVGVGAQQYGVFINCVLV